MQRFIAAILILFGLSSDGQGSAIKFFKLIIIKPDTSIIDESLYSERDSIEIAHLKSFYQCLKIPEKVKNDSSKALGNFYLGLDNKLIPQNDYILLENEAKRFKYFQLLSEYSRHVYDFYFNSYLNNFQPRTPSLIFIEWPNQKTDLSAIRYLSNSEEADYVIYFENIHTVVNENLLLLKLTTFLYSRKEDKLIFVKQTEGDLKNRSKDSEMSAIWNCNTNIRLSCLLINSVRTSVEGIIDILKKRQIVE